MNSYINKLNKKKKALRALVITLELLAIGLLIYLIVLPIWPVVKYKLVYQGKAPHTDWQDIDTVKQKTIEVISQLTPASPASPVCAGRQGEQDNPALPDEETVKQEKVSILGNRVIITKIGVNAPIIDSEDGNYALAKGAWHLPDSSTPDKGSNTVITGHRFKYLPPNNLTFYLFHKLETGDIVSVVWQDKNYFYRIKEIKVVDKNDISILKPSEEPILTLFTCDPIYSQKNRLVVIGELIEG